MGWTDEDYFKYGRGGRRYYSPHQIPPCPSDGPHYTGELRLSILIPVYNERTVVERSLAQVLAAPLPEKHGSGADHRGRLLYRWNRRHSLTG